MPQFTLYENCVLSYGILLSYRKIKKIFFYDFQVKPVASITLKSLSDLVVNGNGGANTRPAFPIGATVLFGVTLHDNMGRQFDISSIPLQHRANR